MTLLRRIFRSLFWLLVVSWSVYLLQRVARTMMKNAAAGEPAGSAPQGTTSVPGRKLTRDPVCGLHLPESSAIPYRSGQETIYFCSEACRNSYLGTVKKLAVNA